MAGDVHQLNIIGNVGGEYVENVLHFYSGILASSATPELDAQDLINTWIADVQALYLACCPSDYSLGGYKAKRVNNTGGPTFVAPVSVLTPGTYATAVAATGVGPLITGNYYDAGAVKPSWRTTRIFLPGQPLGSLVDDEWQAPMPARVASMCSVLNMTLSTGPNQWAYAAWSRAHAVDYVIVGMELSFLVGTQRRRYKPVI